VKGKKSNQIKNLRVAFFFLKQVVHNPSVQLFNEKQKENKKMKLGIYEEFVVWS
jgi:hypothetical protein